MSEGKAGDGKGAVSPETKDKARELLADWRVWLTEGLNQVETFTKEKPAAGLSLSFIAGFIAASWFRRR